VSRAQNAAALDANATGDQVDARPARLAFGTHLRCEEEPDLLHHRQLRTVICRVVRPSAFRRGDAARRTLPSLRARDSPQLGKERRWAGPIRERAQRSERVLGIHRENGAERVGVDADPFELGKEILEALFVSHRPLDLSLGCQ
jgi:hypothetical protein